MKRLIAKILLVCVILSLTPTFAQAQNTFENGEIITHRFNVNANTFQRVVDTNLLPPNTTVTYSSSDPDIAKVDANNGVVEVLKTGTVTITATATGHSNSFKYQLFIYDAKSTDATAYLSGTFFLGYFMGGTSSKPILDVNGKKINFFEGKTFTEMYTQLQSQNSVSEPIYFDSNNKIGTMKLTRMLDSSGKHTMHESVKDMYNAITTLISDPITKNEITEFFNLFYAPLMLEIEIDTSKLSKEGRSSHNIEFQASENLMDLVQEQIGGDLSSGIMWMILFNLSDNVISFDIPFYEEQPETTPAESSHSIGIVRTDDDGNPQNGNIYPSYESVGNSFTAVAGSDLILTFAPNDGYYASTILVYNQFTKKLLGSQLLPRYNQVVFNDISANYGLKILWKKIPFEELYTTDSDFHAIMSAAMARIIPTDKELDDAVSRGEALTGIILTINNTRFETSSDISRVAKELGISDGTYLDRNITATEFQTILSRAGIQENITGTVTVRDLAKNLYPHMDLEYYGITDYLDLKNVSTGELN